MKITVSIVCFVITCSINYAKAQALDGTHLLTGNGDRSQQMLDGAHKMIERKIGESIAGRAGYWNRDFSSARAYENSIEPNRKRFMKYIGVVEDEIDSSTLVIHEKLSPVYLEKIAVNDNSIVVAETDKYSIYEVRWPVLKGVFGEGLLLQPKNKISANIIALPDADQTPEQLAGLSPGIPEQSQFARRLAENGFCVLIPVLIDRNFVFAGRAEQQTHREWIFRQAYHMGRHIVGYEVQKVMKAIDWFKNSSDPSLKIGVAGYNEGGLIAFYSAAVDKRIDAVLVSGYFNTRQGVSDEPLYRNVWGLLTEFGDAEITSLIAPRPVVIEYSSVAEVVDKVRLPGNNNVGEEFPFDGYKGTIKTPPFKDVQAEFNRANGLVKTGFQQRELINGNSGQALQFGTNESLQKLANYLGFTSSLNYDHTKLADRRKNFDIHERQTRQVKELEDHVQELLHNSDRTRNRYFLYKVMPEFADRTWNPRPYQSYISSDRFIGKAKDYRKYFAEEVLGKFDDKYLPPNAHTTKMYDKNRWTGYEVMLDVYPDLIAYGILLIPKDIKNGERRPVVVCQHGRNDIPQKLIEGNNSYYSDVASKLADQGFVVYVPQNPYRGEDRYRWLSKKGQAIKKSLFSFILAQHEQTLHWLNSLSFVDSSRIAFYGLSYGGETAMRVPAVLQGYCLSICSGDFGDWTRKVVDIHNPRSFMFTIEWEMPYFDMGSKFSYAEMAYLIFPRPFMVERGHHDMVQPDEWVSYEYGKIRYFYDQFNNGDKTEIEFFNGGHAMRMEGTFRFLHKHLNWP